MDLRRALLQGEEDFVGPSLPQVAEHFDAAAGEREEEEEQEYVPVKRRRMLDSQDLQRRLGRAAPETLSKADAAAVRPAGGKVGIFLFLCKRCRFSSPGQETAQPSLLVRAAELKRDKPVEDEQTRREREEMDILRSITARCAVLHSLDGPPDALFRKKKR